MQLLSGKSIILYLPPKATAGLATLAVRTPNRLPWPPASNIAIISFLIMSSPLLSNFYSSHYTIVLILSEQILQIKWTFCELFIKISKSYGLVFFPYMYIIIWKDIYIYDYIFLTETEHMEEEGILCIKSILSNLYTCTLSESAA